MSLEQLVHDIIDMMNEGENVDIEPYDKAKEDYKTELKTYHSATTLKKIVEIHLFELPVDIILETSRRVVEVDRSVDSLRLLASQLSLFEPERHEEINELFQEADNLDRSADNHSVS
jgi:hypothetical protein